MKRSKNDAPLSDFGLELAVLGFKRAPGPYSNTPTGRHMGPAEKWLYYTDGFRRNIKVEIYPPYVVALDKDRVLTKQRIKIFHGRTLKRSTTNFVSARRKIVAMIEEEDNGT